MYDKTVTVFCRYEDSWYPTVLHNVDLNTDKAAILAKYGRESQDNAALHIRYQNAEGGKMVGEKLWLPPKEWSAAPGEALTFKSGDFFWQGEWPNEGPVDDASHTEGFYDHMAKSHDFVFRISTVGGPYTVIPHFEIMGR